MLFRFAYRIQGNCHYQIGRPCPPFISEKDTTSVQNVAVNFEERVTFLTFIFPISGKVANSSRVRRADVVVSNPISSYNRYWGRGHGCVSVLSCSRWCSRRLTMREPWWWRGERNFPFGMCRCEELHFRDVSCARNMLRSRLRLRHLFLGCSNWGM